MDHEPELIKEIRALVRQKRRWPLDAYLFVYQAIDAAQRQVGERRHVTPRELLEGFRTLAIEHFGPLALMVCRGWKLERTIDVGQMVMDMVDRGLMTKTDTDRLEDFADAFSIEEAFAPESLLPAVAKASLPAYRPVARSFPGATRPAAAAAQGAAPAAKPKKATPAPAKPTPAQQGADLSWPLTGAQG